MGAMKHECYAPTLNTHAFYQKSNTKPVPWGGPEAGQCLRPPREDHRSLSKKSVSNSEKNSVSHYTPGFDGQKSLLFKANRP